MGRFSRGILSGVSKTTLLSWYEVKGCIFFLFYDVFRRITTQKQLFFADLRDCVALGMEYFCAYATLLDFGDNLRCMKQVANSLACQGIRQSVALHYTSHATSQAKLTRSRAVALYYTSHATSQAEPARSRAVAL